MKRLKTIRRARHKVRAMLGLSPLIIVTLLLALMLWRTDSAAVSGLFQSPPVSPETASPTPEVIEAEPTETATPAPTVTPAEPTPTPDERQRYAEEESNLEFEWGMLFDSVSLLMARLWLCCGVLIFLAIPVLFVVLWAASKRRQ
jgi:hypothetical protein